MDTTITTLEFCTGYGGIGLGLKNIFGERMRTIAYCELEGFAQANLLSKMEKGLMDVAPIWNDLKTFPYESFHGLVDILIAGYPCQPFSSAGKRAGKEDPRHLWPWIADGIRLLQPRMCFFENVEGHISLGLSTVISDLEELGYKSSFGIFSAAEVGAPHQRKRVFILAMADNGGEGLQGDISRLLVSSGRQEQGGSVGGGGRSSGDRELADTDSAGSRQDWKSSEPRPNCIEQSSVIEGGSKSGEIQNGLFWPTRPGQPQHGWEPPRVVGNAASLRSHRGGEDGNWEQPEMLGARLENMGNAAEQGCQRSGGANDPRGTIDRPTESNGGCAYGPMEQIQRQAQPSLGRDADGTAGGLGYAELQVSCDNRTDELRLLGNGVVPATAERAFRTLLTELNTK